MAFSGAGILWLSIWFCLNVGLTLLNKSLMVFWGFKFPILMSFIHQSISTFFSFIESNINKNKNKYDLSKNGISEETFERTVMTRIFSLSILFTLNIVVGNMSLNYCTVAFTQVVRAIIPMITMMFSVFVLKQKYSTQQFIACFIICVGVAASCFGEIGLTMKGLFYTILGCFLSSGKSISIKLLLTGQYTLQSADLLARIAPFSAIEMFGLALFDQEPIRMLEDPHQKYHPTIWCILGCILSGCMAYFLNLTNFLATHHTSPLTVTIAGCVKQITTIVISVFLFHKSLTFLNVIGIVVTTFGSTWYSLLGLKAKQAPKKDTTPLQQDNEYDKTIPSLNQNFQHVPENDDEFDDKDEDDENFSIGPQQANPLP